MQKNHISTYLNQYSNDIKQMLKHPNRPIGLSTGISHLDVSLSGLREGNLILVAARPAMGKTGFAVSISYNIACNFQKSDKAILYFTLGSSGVMLVQKFISITSNIPAWNLRRPTNILEKEEDINENISSLSKLPIYLNYDAANIHDVKSAIEDVQKEKKVGFIVIDYLQSFGSGQFKTYTEILSQLKSIAQKLNIPILILSNIKRELEFRDCKRPLLSDLWGLDKKEASVDVVLFLYREFYYLQNEEPKRRHNESLAKFNSRLKEWQDRCEDMKNVCEVIIAKNNNGPVSSFKTYYNNETSHFANYASLI